MKEFNISNPLVLIIGLMLLFAGCKSDERELLEPRELGAVSSDLVLSARTIIVDESNINSVAQLDELGEEIVFDNPDGRLAGVQKGDILLFTKTEKTPYGLLRRVISVSPQNGQYLVKTEQGTLSESIESGHISFAQPVGLATIDEMTLEDGVTFSGDSTDRLNGLGLNFDIEKQVGDITLSGGFSLHSKAEMEVVFEYFSVDRMRIQLELEQNLELSASTGIDIPLLDTEIKLGKIRLTPIIVGVVIIVPEIELELDLEGKLYGGVTIAFEQEFKALAGANYENESWEKIWREDLKLDLLSFRPTAGLEFEAELEPSIAYKIYGVIGPEFEVMDVFGKFEADLFASPCWKVSMGIDAEFELKADIFGKEFGVEIPLERFSVPVDEGECAATGTGRVEGIVNDVVTGSPISGVLVNFFRDGIQLGGGTTNADGVYSFEVPAGIGFTMEFVKSGYLPVKIYNVEIFEESTTFIETVLQIDGQYSGVGAIGGKVFDAFTGAGIDGATIFIREGLGNESGAILATTTSLRDGSYSFSNIQAGNYTAEANQSGYNPGFFSVVCVGNQTTGFQNGTISPILPDSLIRVILTWGVNPDDLDSHLTGPLPDNSGRFHVYYSNRIAPNSAANLDVDDVSSYGPETITILQQDPGTYRYSIHDYSNRSSGSSNELSRSNARVQVYVGNTQVADMNVPNLPGTLWTVFEYTDGNFSIINDMSFESDPSNVKSTKTDGSLMLKLPPK